MASCKWRGMHGLLKILGEVYSLHVERITISGLLQFRYYRYIRGPQQAGFSKAIKSTDGRPWPLIGAYMASTRWSLQRQDREAKPFRVHFKCTTVPSDNIQTHREKSIRVHSEKMDMNMERSLVHVLTTVVLVIIFCSMPPSVPKNHQHVPTTTWGLPPTHEGGESPPRRE
jgi:hypothetical protein